MLFDRLDPLVTWIASIAIAYLLGAIPFGLIVGKLVRGVDIREYGSGKVGATNTLRTLGRGPSLLVFALDLAKGAAAVLLPQSAGAPPAVSATAAVAAVIGHCWSPYIRFGGGRGVAGSLGALFVIHPPTGFVAFGAAIVTMLVSRYASLGSLVGTAVAAVILGILIWSAVLSPEWLIYVVGAAGIIYYRHSDNIARLRAGTERRIGDRAKASHLLR